MRPPADQRQGEGARADHEPLSIRFANTCYAVRGQIHDGIGTPDLLREWLGDNADELGVVASVADAEVGTFVAMRDAIRELVRAAVAGDVPDEDQVGLLNRLSAGAPRWPTLVDAGGEYHVVEQVHGDGIDRVLATIAQDAVWVLGGRLRDLLRDCQAPGCVLFFVKDHPRREWCSAACGNRARAARHYLRHRDD
jgi:predicted RNA-binding Zn ribbon-like protein